MTTVDHDRIAALAGLLGSVEAPRALDFTSPDPAHLPAVGAVHATDFFFVATLNQYCFWADDKERWTGSFMAPVDGVSSRGSDYLWRVFQKAARKEPGCLSPSRLALAGPAWVDRMLRGGDEQHLLPMLESHVELTCSFAEEMHRRDLSPLAAVETAASSAEPGRSLLELLATLPGYMEDPLQKKSMLLLLILVMRPEGLLPPHATNALQPIVDYHHLRLALRLGLVEIGDPGLRQRVEDRRFVTGSEEGRIRQAVFEAVRRLAGQSGMGIPQLDALFFGARRFCPETTLPRCEECMLSPACARRVELFQPIFRTTWY